MAIMGPLWNNHAIEIDCDKDFRLIDPFNTTDVAKHIFGEVQAYTLSSATDTAGYLLIDYELEFKTTMFTPHSLTLPLTSGPGASYTLVDSSTTPTLNNAVQLTNNTIYTTYGTGTIWKAYINADESTPATGTTLANAWNTCVAFGSSTTATTLQTVTFPIVDGQAIYLVSSQSSNLYAYVSLEAAINGDASGQLYYRTTGSTAASWNVNAYFVRLGLYSLATPS